MKAFEDCCGRICRSPVLPDALATVMKQIRQHKNWSFVTRCLNNPENLEGGCG